MRYRDLERVDLDCAREKVRDWMAAHPDGTLDQMAEDLKGDYPEYQEEMAVVLRGLMAGEQLRPAAPAATGTAGETR